MLAGALSVIFLRYFYLFAVWFVRKARDAVPTRYVSAASPEDEHIQILVVGDIGRSPRMQYHGISVAKHGKHVDLVGYKGGLSSTATLYHEANVEEESARHPALIGNPKVALYPLSPQPEWIAWGTLPLLAIPYKVIHQFCTLFYTLMYATPPAQWIIIQVSELPYQSSELYTKICCRTHPPSRPFTWLSSWLGLEGARSLSTGIIMATPSWARQLFSSH